MKRLTATLCLTIAVLLGSAGMSWSADFQKGLTAAHSGDFATALREWTPLAEQGNADAQNNLGMMYETGQGVPQDYKTAVKWYTLAAEQGDASAQYNLGLMYENGQGVPQDDKTAVKWYTLAAEQGDAGAQFNLGVMYRNGRGVPQSELEVSFTEMQVNLRSEPGLRSPVTKVVKQAIGKKTVLLKQNKSWIQIRFEGEDFWVYALFLDRNLTPKVMEVLFKVSDVNLRSGPGTRFPISKVLKDAKFRRAVPFGEFENWVHIVFDKHPYWVHSSLILQYESSAISSKSADQGTNQLSHFDEQKMKAAAGAPKAMESVSGIYEHDENLHLKMSYMWLILAMENAPLDDKKRIQNNLEENIIPKLRDSEIASAEKRIKRCKESKYRDCGETSMRVFHGK